MIILTKWLNKMERKYGRYAIKNLMFYIVIANAVVFFFSLLDRSGFLYSNLVLFPQLVMRGQVWRLLTFIAIPPSNHFLWLIIALYFYYLVGTNLEREWGSFKFNLYYLFGVICTIAASFLTGYPATAAYINLSLFFAFAYIYPDFELMLYFILPVKVKYLGMLSGLYLVYVILTSPFAVKLIALVPAVSFLLFFGSDILKQIKQKRQVHENRKRFFSEVRKAQKPKDKQ